MKRLVASNPFAFLSIESLERRFLLSANIRPNIGGLTASPDPVPAGAVLALIANNVSDPEGGVAKVEFYRDSNGNDLFEKSIDTLIGLDGSPRHGWSLVVSTSGFPTGPNTFYARTRDDGGEVSKPAVVLATVQGKLNLIGSYSGSIIFDHGAGQDVLQIDVTSQTRQAYFDGTYHQVGADLDFTFDGTIGKNSTFTMVYAGAGTGTAIGTLSADGLTLSGTFKTLSNGKTLTGHFSVHRI